MSDPGETPSPSQLDFADFKIAGYVPQEVTAARQAGRTVTFVHEGDSSTWCWQIEGGELIKCDLEAWAAANAWRLGRS